MVQEEKKQWAIAELQQMAGQLGRTPKKDDFPEVKRAQIKAYLGPWPRALEAAGLKAVRGQCAKSAKGGKL